VPAENVHPLAEKEAAKSDGSLEGTSRNLLLNSDFEISPLPGKGGDVGYWQLAGSGEEWHPGAGVDYWRPDSDHPVKAAVVKTNDAHSGQQVLRIEPAKPGTTGAIYCDEKRVYAAWDAIQKLGPEARFIPRWDSVKYVRVSSKDCPAALYAAGKQAVIVVSNFGDGAVQTSVDCDTQALGWGAATFGASDAITGAALNVSRNQFTATVPPNNFVMIRVSPIPQHFVP
jgi:hypothetical protein